MPGIGPMEIIVVLIIALLVFGPKRLPELGRSVGAGMRSFKDSVAGRDEPQELDARHEKGVASAAPERPR